MLLANCLQIIYTHIVDKTNLTFVGIKWPLVVDIPFNKTQTLFEYTTLSFFD